MCGLCGVFGNEDHWTDGASLGGGTRPRTRRHERLHRFALANRVLAHYGLKLSDWQGSSYVLATRTGRTAMVDHLAALWPVAAQLSPRPCDPLDEALIAALEQDR
jgi:hypothetical protein